MHWDRITDIILIASFGVLAIWGGLGLYQWFTRKSLKKVDRSLLYTLVPLILVLIVYVFFDKILVVSTRPDGSGEPSFPSSHVLAVTTIFGLTALNLKRYVAQRPLRILILILMLFLLVLTCVGRVLANKHWPADVFGSLVFSTLFVGIYYYLIGRKHHA